MALRLVTRQAIRYSARSFATTKELTIHITFVDQQGNKAVLPGRIGHTLLYTAQLHGIDIDGQCRGGGGTTQVRRTENWVEYIYGEGLACGNCHVQIPPKFHSLLPERFPEEKFALERTWEDTVTDNSRCACSIMLEKAHDGMVVLVPNPTIVDII